jgi:hypothetical protein
MYYLDFATIIQLLKEFRRSGVLQTELPASIGNTQEKCLMQLNLLRGEITDCLLILDSGGIIAADEKVLRQVKGLGPLEWTFSPLKESHTAPMKALDKILPSTPLSVPDVPLASAKQPYSFIILLVPYRLATVDQSILNRLTRQQRRVLALVDGRRNISQIAALLFSTANMESGAQEVFALLKDLEKLKVVALQLQ